MHDIMGIREVNFKKRRRKEWLILQPSSSGNIHRMVGTSIKHNHRFRKMLRQKIRKLDGDGSGEKSTSEITHLGI